MSNTYPQPSQEQIAPPTFDVPTIRFSDEATANLERRLRVEANITGIKINPNAWQFPNGPEGRNAANGITRVMHGLKANTPGRYPGEPTTISISEPNEDPEQMQNFVFTGTYGLSPLVADNTRQLLMTDANALLAELQSPIRLQ